ncbi:hypothetical protein GCM10025857_02410 [Alicyclobacillus contaminans]|nr:hypothetical protein GCM10025857_02410 [Alicyclobacillus contaminans]
MNEHKPPVLCIVGPTATGKSDLGIALAKILNGEVLSADSMQVYRGMDVGTAKVPLHARQGVPHHLLDLVEPDVRFTVADWVTAADEVIAALHRRGKLPIVVGGTGLYIRAICEDLDFGAATEAPEARQRWVRYLEAHGAEALHAALAKVDPPTAQRLHPNDTRRVLRALEVYEAGVDGLCPHRTIGGSKVADIGPCSSG